jgi:hypothetical protein
MLTGGNRELADPSCVGSDSDGSSGATPPMLVGRQVMGSKFTVKSFSDIKNQACYLV